MNTLKFNQLSFNHIGEQKSSVKLQSKTVTFDESDNLEIVPDSGYVGLSKVNVIKDKNDYLYEEYIAPIINNEEMK